MSSAKAALESDTRVSLLPIHGLFCFSCSNVGIMSDEMCRLGKGAGF